MLRLPSQARAARRYNVLSIDYSYKALESMALKTQSIFSQKIHLSASYLTRQRQQCLSPLATQQI